ncbi:MAG: ADP-ribosylation factor-like protein [Candidatus Hermodarchaeota archaeon]
MSISELESELKESKGSGTSNLLLKTNHGKIVVLGEGGVGKTAFVEATIRMLKKLEISVASIPTNMTIAISFSSFRWVKDEKEIKMQIWDFGGQSQFKDMGLFKVYCQGAHAAIVCFDIEDLDSLELVPEWLDFLPDTVPRILVATKDDNLKNDEELERLIDDYAKEFNFSGVLRISLDTNPERIINVFNLVFDILVDQYGM